MQKVSSAISKTRKDLIDVARMLFAKNGVESTTMNDIAKASQRGRRTLYTYFSSKNDIYKAVIESELFDRVLGEGGATTEEEFRTKVKEQLEKQFKPNADHLFIHEMRDIIVEQMKDVKFPDEFLKRWLLESSENRTEEQVEEDYPKILEDLKFHIAKQKIIEENEIKIEFKDIEELATEVARAQFAQYGMTNLPADVLQNYAKSMLEKEETVQNLFEKATEDKVIDWLKENITVIEKIVSSKEFNEIMTEHSHLHSENVADENEVESETEEVSSDETNE